MNRLIRLVSGGRHHFCGLLAPPSLGQFRRQRVCFSTTGGRDPTAALSHFYGESFGVPSLDQGPSPTSGTPSMGDGEEAHTAPPTALLTVEALIRDETDAEITAYKIDPAFGKPPRQLVLHLDTNRQRKGLAEALLRKLRKLGVSVQYEGLNSGEADWIVLEVHDCMIHIFDPETRLTHAIDEQLGRLAATIDAAADGQCAALLQQLASSTPRSLNRLRQRPLTTPGGLGV